MKALVSVVMMTLLAACATKPNQNASGVKAVPATANNAVMATDSNNHGAVSVASGQSLVIKLASHADGGYEWMVADTSSFSQPTYSHDVSGCAPQALGCSGFDVFTFSTNQVAAGAYTIQLVEKRFGTQPTSATYSLTVNVQGATPPGPASANDATALDADNGGSIVASLGQNIVIKLASHSDGGYQWTLKNSGGLDLSNYTHDTSACAPVTLGCSGLEVFNFSTSGAAAGVYTIRLQEMRFGRQPGQVYSLTVNLQ